MNCQLKAKLQIKIQEWLDEIDNSYHSQWGLALYIENGKNYQFMKAHLIL